MQKGLFATAISMMAFLCACSLAFIVMYVVIVGLTIPQLPGWAQKGVEEWMLDIPQFSEHIEDDSYVDDAPGGTQQDQNGGQNGNEDANGGGEGFASLRLDGDKVMVLKDNHPQDVYQILQEGAKLFAEVGPSATAPIKLGHIYLVRVADKKDKSFQQVIKLMVIAYRPDEAVTLRWELL